MVRGGIISAFGLKPKDPKKHGQDGMKELGVTAKKDWGQRSATRAERKRRCCTDRGGTTESLYVEEL